MSAETKVDVLAVMDEAARHADGGSAPLNGDAIRQARAIVTELIDAASVIEQCRESALKVEWDRLDAALARIGGAA